MYCTVKWCGWPKLKQRRQARTCNRAANDRREHWENEEENRADARESVGVQPTERDQSRDNVQHESTENAPCECMVPHICRKHKYDLISLIHCMTVHCTCVQYIRTKFKWPLKNTLDTCTCTVQYTYVRVHTPSFELHSMLVRKCLDELVWNSPDEVPKICRSAIVSARSRIRGRINYWRRVHNHNRRARTGSWVGNWHP